MKRYIRNAEQSSTKEDLLKESVDTLKDDFDYAISGVEKLAADGNIAGALEQVSALSEMINASIEEIAENVAQGD